MGLRLLSLLFITSWALPSMGNTLVFWIDPSEPQAFRYQSGDLPCDVSAGMEGYLSIEIYESSQTASLSFLNVTLGTTQTELFGMPFEYPEGHFCTEFSDSLVNATLASVMPGTESLIPGIRSNENVFVFGPQLTDDRSFMVELTLDASSSQARLAGSSAFYGDDGPTFSVDALLVPVPEPTTCFLAVFIAIGGIVRRIR